MLRRLRIDEAGFTLIELLVAMTLALGVCSLALDLIPTADSSSRASSAREAATVAAQAAVSRITLEARMATAAAVQNSSVLDLTLPVRGSTATQHVRYSCSAGACTRIVCKNQVTGSLVGVGCDDPLSQSQVVTGLTGDSVFTALLGPTPAGSAAGIAGGVTPTMDHLDVSLSLSVPSSQLPVQIDDGTSFANFSL